MILGIVSSGEYTASKLHVRNEYIVNQSDAMLCVYDGSTGGTESCINYAIKHEKPMIIIDPLHFDFDNLNKQIKNIIDILR